MRLTETRVADAVDVGDEAGLHIQIRFRRQRPVWKIFVDDLANELDERRRIVHRRVVRRNAIRRKNAVVHAHLVERADEAAVVCPRYRTDCEVGILHGIVNRTGIADGSPVVVNCRSRSSVHDRQVFPPRRCTKIDTTLEVSVTTASCYQLGCAPAVNFPFGAGNIDKHSVLAVFL